MLQRDVAGAIKDGVLYLASTFWIALSLLHVPLVSYGAESIGLYDLVLILFFVLWFGGVVWRGRIIHFDMWVVYYFAWLFVFAVSLLFNPYRLGSFSLLLFLKNIEFLAGLVVTTFLFSKISPQVFLRQIVLVFVVVLCWSLYDLYSGDWWNAKLPFQEAGSGATWGGVLAVFGLFVLTRPRKTFVQWFVLILAVIGLVFSQGRTQFVGFVVGAAVYYMVMAEARAVIVGVAAFGAILAVGTLALNEFGVVLYGGNPLSYFAPSTVLSDQSFGERLHSWGEMINGFIDAGPWWWIYGSGFGTHRYVDGLYINLLVSGGIIGIVVYSIVLVAGLAKLRYGLVVGAFLAVSSITGELILQSYRFTQAIIPIIIFWYLHEPARNSSVSRA